MAVKAPGESPGKAVGRGTRLAILANVAVMVLAASGVVVLVNYFAGRPALRKRFDLTAHARNTLSPRTVSVLENLREPVECFTFFRPDDPIQEEVARMTDDLLKRYAHHARGNFPVKALDLYKGIAEVMAKAQELKITERNLVVLRVGSRQKEVRLDELAEMDRGFDFGGRGRPPRLVAYKGEEAITNAIVSVTETADRKAYFLRGHGEPETSASREGGLSQFADALRKDGYTVLDLDLGEKRSVPVDATLVAAIRPSRPFLAEETAALRAYLARGGRLFLALDPAPDPEAAADPTGVLSEYGLSLGRGLVCEFMYELISAARMHGRAECAEFSIRGQGLSPSHPITRPLVEGGFALPFSFARPIERAAGAGSATATNLAESSHESWEDLPRSGSFDFRFDKDEEKLGTRAVAVAVEKRLDPLDAGGEDADGPEEGATTKPAAEAKARLVVVGSGAVASNEFFPYTRDFVANGVNWLAEVESLISIAPRPVEERRIDLFGDSPNRAYLFWLCVIAFPALTAATGVIVWWRRRR